MAFGDMKHTTHENVCVCFLLAVPARAPGTDAETVCSAYSGLYEELENPLTVGSGMADAFASFRFTRIVR